MSKHKAKTKIVLAFALATILMAPALYHEAKADAVYQQFCTGAVFPYDPNAPEIVGPDGTQYLNYLLPQDCAGHVAYGSPYAPQPPSPDQNQVKAGAENKRVPWALHEHAYFNDSVQDNDFYKKAFVDQFQITLQYDAVDNTDTLNLQCNTPAPVDYNGDASDLLDCNGQSKPGQNGNDLFGGTTVSTSAPQNDPAHPGKKIVTVTWKFATKAPFGGRPQIFGINNTPGNTFKIYNSDGTVQLALDTSNPYNRDLQFAVHMKSKNNNAQIWSATTTSRVLLADLAMKKSNYPQHFTDGCINNDINNSASGWCYLNPLGGFPTQQVSTPSGTHTYYWFPIGSDVSIWKKPAPPPPQECTALNVTPAGPLSADQLPQNFTVSSLTSGGLQVDYKWEASQQGILTFNTDPNTVHYDSGNNMVVTSTQPIVAPITITVTAVNKNDHKQEYPNPCQKTIVINPPPAQECIALNVTPTGPLAANQLPQAFTITGQTSNGLNLDFKWTASQNGVVSFDNVPYNGTPYYDSKVFPFSYAQTTVSSLQPISTPLTLTVTAVNSNNHSQEFTGPCQKTIVINPTPQLACQKLEIYRNGAAFPASVPFGTPTDNLTTVIQKDQGLDLDLIWSATSGTFNPPPGQNPLTEPNENALVTYANPSNNNTTTVTVQAYDASKGPNSTILCQDSFTITPPPPPQLQCTALNLQINGGMASNVNTIVDGQTVTVQANPQPQPPFNFVQWQETGNGFFTNIPGAPFACQDALNAQPNFANPSSNTSFIAPAFCSYQYTGAVGGSVNVNAYAQDGSNIGNCLAAINVQTKPVAPVCQDLIVNPTVLNQSGVTNFNATPVYANGQPDTVTLQWTSTGGSFSESNSNSLTQTHNSFQPNFQSTFFANDPYNASVTVGVVGAGSQCQKTIPAPQKPVPQCTYLHIQQNGNQLCLNVDNNYNGTFTWLYGNFPFITSNRNYCLSLDNVQPGTTVQAYATDAPQNCKDQFYVPIPPPPVTPPTLEKTVSRENENNYMKTVTVGAQQNGHNTRIDYQLTFTAKSPNTTAAIVDDIAYGIKGTTYPVSVPSGTIVYADSMTVSVPSCSGSEQNWVNCYTGEINTNSLVLHKVSGQVIITYKGELRNSAINQANCSNPNAIVCQEKYPNTAHADYKIYNSQNLVVNSGNLESSALVQVFCQYILARAGGDVFLESDLNAGVNIRVCSIYKTTPNIIITPAPPPPTHIPSTGLPTEIFSINHEICNEGEAGTLAPGLKQYFGKDVSKLSGTCEIKLTLGKSWKQSTITNNIDENKTRISRWDPTLPEGTGAELSFLFNNVDPGAKVYHIKGADVTVDQPFTLSDGPNGGARTVIVEDGDLIINKDITYGTDGSNYNVNQTASLAFIVLNGKIIVSPEVKTMAGVYFVQEGNRPDSGRLFSGSVEGVDSYNPLTVYGSIYGDIDPLFSHRLFAGDPGQEESSILIRFDQRIILNTPPGLKDVLSVEQTQVAN